MMALHANHATPSALNAQLILLAQVAPTTIFIITAIVYVLKALMITAQAVLIAEANAQNAQLVTTAQNAPKTMN